jgi:uncharacterized protein YbaP (TraB family)
MLIKRNERKVISRFALLVVLFTACAYSGYTQSGNATIWEIRKDGNSVFLAGSIHLIRSQDYPMPSAFDSAYKKSSMLVLEADIDRLTDPDIMEYTLNKIMLPEGQTIRTVLNEDVYKRLEGLVGSAVIEALSRYKPSVIVASLQSLFLRNSEFTEKGADFYYLDKSKQDGKSVGFLEDAKIQIDMLSNMTDGIENEYISNAIDDLLKSGNEAVKFVLDWKEGVATATEASISKLRKQWPTVYEITVLNRNSAWMPEIEKYLATKPIEFIIVGMGHIYGPDGLLIQLKNKGYKIKQLNNDATIAPR